MHTPYKLELVKGSDYYKFSTKHGVCYKIALFRTEKIYFPNHPEIKSFDISFFPEQENKSKDDEQERISLTIAEMVKKLLMDGYVITFSCDTSDNKHRGRNRLFKRWFSKYTDHHFK